MHINYNHKFAIGLVATAMLAAPAVAQAQSNLTIKDFVGTINWTQSSGDITATVTRGADELDVSNTSDGTVKIVGDYKSLRVIRCKGGDNDKRISVTRRKNYKSLDEYPALNITVPKNTKVILENSIPFIYGQPTIDGFEAKPRGCGHIEVGDVTSQLKLDMGGSTEFTAFNVGDAKVGLSGSSELTVRNIQDLKVGLSGSSEFTGQKAQSVKAQLSGSSELNLDDINGAVELQLSGSAESRFGDIASGLTYQGSGSSDTVITRVDGAISIKVSGASDVDIHGGVAAPMKAITSGASNVTFKGKASGLEAKASGASEIKVDEVSGRLKESRSGAAEIKIKRYKDVVSDE